MVGPILQGVKCPVNDLSRSSNTIDIIDTALLTIYMAVKKNKISKSKNCKTDIKKSKTKSKKRK